MKRFILGLVISAVSFGTMQPMMRRVANSSSILTARRFFTLGQHDEMIRSQVDVISKLAQNPEVDRREKKEAAQKLYNLLTDKEYESALKKHNGKKFPKMIAGCAAGCALSQNTFASEYSVLGHLALPFINAAEAGFLPAVFPVIFGALVTVLSPIYIPCIVGEISKSHNIVKKTAQRKLERFAIDHLNTKNLDSTAFGQHT